MEGIEEHKKSRIRKKEQKVAQNNPLERVIGANLFMHMYKKVFVKFQK